MEVAGIEVSRELLDSWVGFFAPARQPFFVAKSLLSSLPPSGPEDGSRESEDTFRLWRDYSPLVPVWLDEQQFNSLDRSVRSDLVRRQVAARRGGVHTVRGWSDLLDGSLLRGQADGHRFVMWPSLLRSRAVECVVRFVTSDLVASRHREVAASLWRSASTVLPGARALAGTFFPGSGPNCFGTVMAAAGVTTGATSWTGLEPFEDWLALRTSPGGLDSAPGTVLLWRDSNGRAQHAAVTIGGGWALEKLGQEWSSPRAVLTTAQVIRAARTPGWHLTRHLIS